MATVPPPGLKFKLILLGDFGVGKTTLFHRVRAGRFLQGAHAPDEHLAICERTVQLSLPQAPHLAQISLWDTAGEERFLSLSSCYYRDTDAVLLLYSVQSQLSFDSLPRWVYVARQYCPEAPIFLLGNKTDLEPCLPEDKAEKFSVEHRIAGRFNVSAKTGRAGLPPLPHAAGKLRPPNGLGMAGRSWSPLRNMMWQPGSFPAPAVWPTLPRDREFRLSPFQSLALEGPAIDFSES
ncbi:ras-related protein Rab-35-like isoform X1 [Dermochelys coriacea]|uniref:ras-related protein Rab-35-like isoform X1 n=1 Tax=Dermochelys coriacea TaxID=27794 RepID=UPI0018E7B9E2|nr:ras-related protein Rab-35-like isoform X1 [Dermochelys coriacea]